MPTKMAKAIAVDLSHYDIVKQQLVLCDSIVADLKQVIINKDTVVSLLRQKETNYQGIIQTQNEKEAIYKKTVSQLQFELTKSKFTNKLKSFGLIGIVVVALTLAI
jgi:ATP:corrinoid adenosyltransferase